LFSVNTVGIVTSRDHFVIDSARDALAGRMEEFTILSENEARAKYDLKDNSKWRVSEAQKHPFEGEYIVPVSYRPFDTRWLYYKDEFIERSRRGVMSNLLKERNIGLV